ncbi:DUF4426 domain-containing protein [Luteimonas yindakuii]|nr:DUF4426 domain-containing protein [Luteimonas yindakuii]
MPWRPRAGVARNCRPRMTDVAMSRSFRVASLLACTFALAACGAPPTPPAARGAPEPPAVTRSGDLTVRASVVPTLATSEAAAREYGIERDAHSLLLMIGVRRGDDHAERAVPARVTATAVDLRGVRHDVPLREVAVGDLTDHIGVVRVTPPDTLRFLVEARTGDGEVTQLQFSREVYR